MVVFSVRCSVFRKDFSVLPFRTRSYETSLCLFALRYLRANACPFMARPLLRYRRVSKGIEP